MTRIYSGIWHGDKVFLNEDGLKVILTMSASYRGWYPIEVELDMDTGKYWVHFGADVLKVDYE